MKACPNEFTLQRMASGGTARWKVRRHVDECRLCLSRLATIREEEDILGRIRRVAGSSSRAVQESAGPASPAAPGVERTDAASASDQPVIDGFRITRLIAEGGMGRVYEAEQLHPRRRAALKLLRAGRAAAEQRLRLFRREADALARLRHPDIAVVYCAGLTSAGEPYLAMELVQGETLDKYAANHAMWEEDVLRLMARICRAIDHAHEHGVIHRDLKPSNIMVDASGNPKVLDFGLARVAESDAAAMTTLTLDGRIAGTLAYMSPEQVCCQAGAVDARSDVYALGVILYQLLTGVLPIGVGDRGFAEIVDAIRTDSPVPPSRHRPGLHAEVERIVLRALHKRPAERYQSARELADDIDRRLAGQPIRRSALVSGRWRRRIAAASATLALLAAGTVLSLCAWRSGAAPLPIRETETAARAEDAAEPEEVHRLAPLITLVGDLHDLERMLRSRVESLRAGSDKDRRAMVVRLALVLERQGEYPEAERLFRDALEPEQKAPHRSTVTQIRIARCVGAQGDHEQAQKMFADCMKLVERLGPQQASVRTELQVSMARDLMAQDRFDEAKELLDQAGTSGEESIANVKWSRWSVAGAYADYYRATQDPGMEECWRRRAAEVYTISATPDVCQE